MGTLRPLLGTFSTAQGVRRLLRAPPWHHGGGPIGIPQRTIGDNIVRLGVVYMGATAATYNGSGTLTALGKGEVRFHKIRHDGDALIELDETQDAKKAFSLMPSALADGQEVLCVYDHTITDPDNPGVPQEGWVIFQLAAAADPIRGAVTIGGADGPWTTASGHTLNLLAAIHNDNPPYSIIAHDTLADTYVGVNIEQRGRHFLTARCRISASSPPNDGTILMTDGVDLLSKINCPKGQFRVTTNDGSESGLPAIFATNWSMNAISASGGYYEWEHVFMADWYWFEVNDKIRLWFQYDTPAEGSLTLDYGMTLHYGGDFAPEWTPDT